MTEAFGKAGFVDVVEWDFKVGIGFLALLFMFKGC